MQRLLPDRETPWIPTDKRGETVAEPSPARPARPPLQCQHTCAYLLRLYRTLMIEQPGFRDGDVEVEAKDTVPAVPLPATWSPVLQMSLPARDEIVQVFYGHGALSTDPDSLTLPARALYEAASLYAQRRVKNGCVPTSRPSCVCVSADGRTSYGTTVAQSLGKVAMCVSFLDDQKAPQVLVQVDARLSSDVVLFLAHVATRVVLAPPLKRTEWKIPALPVGGADEASENLRGVSLWPGGIPDVPPPTAFRPLDLCVKPTVVDYAPPVGPEPVSWGVHISDGCVAPRAAPLAGILDVLAVLDAFTVPESHTKGRVVYRGAHCVHAWLGPGSESQAWWAPQNGSLNSEVRVVGDLLPQLRETCIRFLKQEALRYAETIPHPPRLLDTDEREEFPFRNPDGDHKQTLRRKVELLCGHPPLTVALREPVQRRMRERGLRCELKTFTFPFVRLASEQGGPSVLDSCKQCLDALVKNTPFAGSISIRMGAIADCMTAVVACWIEHRSLPPAVQGQEDTNQKQARDLLIYCRKELRKIANEEEWARPMLELLPELEQKPTPAKRARKEKHTEDYVVTRGDSPGSGTASPPRRKPTEQQRAAPAPEGVHETDPDVMAFMAERGLFQRMIEFFIEVRMNADKRLVYAVVEEAVFRPGETFLTRPCPERALLLPSAMDVAASSVRNFSEELRNRQDWEVAPLLHMVMYHPAFRAAPSLRTAVNVILDREDYQSLLEEDKRRFTDELVEVLELVARMGRVGVLHSLSDDEASNVANFLMFLCSLRQKIRALAVACLVTESHVNNVLQRDGVPCPREIFPDPRQWERIWDASTAAEKLLYFLDGGRVPLMRIPSLLEVIQRMLYGIDLVLTDSSPTNDAVSRIIICVLLARAYMVHPSTAPGPALAAHNLRYLTQLPDEAKFVQELKETVLDTARGLRECFRGAIVIDRSQSRGPVVARAVPPGQDLLVAVRAPTRITDLAVRLQSSRPVSAPPQQGPSVTPARSTGLALVSLQSRPDGTMTVPGLVPENENLELVPFEDDDTRTSRGEWIRSPTVRGMWNTCVRLVHDSWGSQALRKARKVYMPSAQADALLGVILETALETRKSKLDATSLCLAVCALSSLRHGPVAFYDKKTEDKKTEDTDTKDAEYDDALNLVLDQRSGSEEGHALFMNLERKAYAHPGTSQAVPFESRCAVLDTAHHVAALYEADASKTELLVRYAWLCLVADGKPGDTEWTSWSLAAQGPSHAVREYTFVALFIAGTWTAPDEGECSRLAAIHARSDDELARLLSYTMPLLARVRGIPTVRLTNGAYLLRQDVQQWLQSQALQPVSDVIVY